MENDTVPNQRLKCPILSVPEIKVEPKEGNDSQPILKTENEKIGDLYLKSNGDESCCNDEFIESAPMLKIKDENIELDQKELDLCLEESCYIKCETKFKKIQIESSDRDYSTVKLEIIEQEEIHIKDEEDNEDRLNEKIPKLEKQTELHQCLECPYNTVHKRNLKAHIIKHKKGNEIDWHCCLECPYKTCRARDLKRHAKTHNTNRLLLKCLHFPECSFQTHLKWYFRSHLLTHKSGGFKCPKCSYQSRTKSQLAVHQLKHDSIAKWLSCTLCSFKTPVKDTLKMHCQRWHGIDPYNNFKSIEILKCSECSYESSFKSDMKKHQLIHNQNNWLHCPDCAYNTPYKSSWKKHQMRRHHRENIEGWHKCPECTYENLDKSNLEKHMISHKSVDKIQWLECFQCNFKTGYKQSLIRHQLKHKEEHEIKWFFCYECGLKSKRKSNLVTHILNHKKQSEKRYL